MGKKRRRGKDAVVKHEPSIHVDTPERDAQLIKEWLKNNEPSVKFNDIPMHKVHLQPEPTLGANVPLIGGKV